MQIPRQIRTAEPRIPSYLDARPGNWYPSPNYVACRLHAGHGTCRARWASDEHNSLTLQLCRSSNSDLQCTQAAEIPPCVRAKSQLVRSRATYCRGAGTEWVSLVLAALAVYSSHRLLHPFWVLGGTGAVAGCHLSRRTSSRTKYTHQ